MRSFLVVLWLALAVAGRAQEPVPLEWSYGSHPLQRLDVYQPDDDGRACRPTVVLVHGGGFARGDKRRPFGTLLFEHFRDVLLADGWTVVALNYRLALDDQTVPAQHPWDDKYPAAHDDVQAALAFVRDNRAALGASWPVAVIAESAGGNLGAHLALSPASQVFALVGVGGYPDLVQAQAPVVLAVARNYIGCAREACPKTWDAASPARHAARAVPMLLWHGDADTVVDYGETFNLAAVNARTAERAGMPVPPTTVQIVPGAGHTGLPGFATPARDEELVRFLGRHAAGAGYACGAIGLR